MKLQELIEGKMKDLAYNLEWDRQHNPGPAPTPTQIKPPEVRMNYMVTIGHNPWKKFATEKEAMTAATNAYNKNPRRRVDVVPI